MTESVRFGRFEVREELGRGACGIVYLATDPTHQREVALKVFEAHPGIPAAELAELKTRFRGEAATAGALSHRNVVAIHESGEDGSNLFIAMEYVDGETLEHKLEQGEVPTPEQICEISTALAAALDLAHERGIVHRDVKPANIMIDREGTLKVADFGVARQTSSTLTRTGSMIGTPAFMAPEQIKGRGVSGRSDQFALAVVVYRMLTGRLPFAATTPMELMNEITTAEPPRASSQNMRLDRTVDVVLMRALAKDPAHRFESCAEFAAALSRIFLDQEVATPSIPPPLREEGDATARITAAELAAASIPGVGGPAAQRRGEQEPAGATRWRLVTIAAAAVALALLLAWYLLGA
jgi:serine/threonine-protein kinase